MSTATEPSVADACAHRPAHAAHEQIAAQLGRARIQERRDTARAVAALFHLAAVGIENAIEHAAGRVARRFQHQGLIEADAGVTVGEGAQPVRVPWRRRGGSVEYQEIVAKALHLHELDAHAGRA